MQKVVIITGASSGIGEALVKHYAILNYRIVMAARNLQAMNQIKQNLSKFQENILIHKTDVSKENDCELLINFTINKFGKIDILISNAGITMRAMFDEVELSVLKKVMDTNYWACVYLTKYALPHLLKTNGSLVGVSSIGGYLGMPGRIGYSASKSALQAFLEVIRIENQYKGLHVLVACPGFTKTQTRFNALLKDGTKQNATPRNEAKMMSPEKVAKLIYKAVKKRKRDLILTTIGKFGIWLRRLFPKLSDKFNLYFMMKELKNQEKYISK